jgi:hypothetical protein
VSIVKVLCSNMRERERQCLVGGAPGVRSVSLDPLFCKQLARFVDALLDRDQSKSIRITRCFGSTDETHEFSG